MVHASSSSHHQRLRRVHSTHILVQLVPLLAGEMSQTPSVMYQESATVTSFRRRSRWMNEVREGGSAYRLKNSGPVKYSMAVAKYLRLNTCSSIA